MPMNRALSKRQRQSEPAFDRILRAAREMFAAEGFAATSLDDVCARAGVTKGAVYYHFRGKSELFEAVFEDQARQVTVDAAAAMGQYDEPWASVTAGLAAFLDGATDPGVQRILFQDAPSLLGWARVREIDRQYGLALVQDALETLSAAGEIAVEDPSTMSHLMLAALIEAALLLHVQRDVPGQRDRIVAELRTLLVGLIPK